MPIPGLSLIGFVKDQAYAERYLAQTCVPANPDPAALVAEWDAAKAKLGPAVPNAGKPDIQPIPTSHAGYVAQLYSQPWAMQVFPILPMVQFALVEVDPLLAYQQHISGNHSAKKGHGFSNPPTLDELLATCLQLNRPAENWTRSYGPSSMLITSEDLNVRSLLNGPLSQEVVGMLFGISLPWAHVVRFNGRCYLHNGFHRALAARLAGATHIPCIFRDVATPAEAGIKADGGTFPLDLLESADPPTIAHYTTGRAHQVQLRKFSKALHVSWAEYFVAEE